MKVETSSFSEMLVAFLLHTRRHIPEDSNSYGVQRGHIKSHNVIVAYSMLMFSPAQLKIWLPPCDLLFFVKKDGGPS